MRCGAEQRPRRGCGRQRMDNGTSRRRMERGRCEEADDRILETVKDVCRAPLGLAGCWYGPLVGLQATCSTCRAHMQVCPCRATPQAPRDAWRRPWERRLNWTGQGRAARRERGGICTAPAGRQKEALSQAWQPARQPRMAAAEKVTIGREARRRRLRIYSWRAGPERGIRANHGGQDQDQVHRESR